MARVTGEAIPGSVIQKYTHDEYKALLLLCTGFCMRSRPIEVSLIWCFRLVQRPTEHVIEPCYQYAADEAADEAPD